MHLPSDSHIWEARVLEVEEKTEKDHKTRFLRICFDEGSKVESHSASLHEVAALLSFPSRLS